MSGIVQKSFLNMKIAIVCSGLGIIQRGFESSTAIWAETLRGMPGVEVALYSGGSYPGAKRLWCLHQKSLSVALAKKLRLARDGARIQQVSMFPALRRELGQRRPDYVWLQEWTLARKLQAWVREENLPTRIVFCNGAPAGARDCMDFDRVISLHSQAEQELLALGYPAARSAVIPYPITFPNAGLTKAEARQSLGLPATTHVVLCAAAWNRHHKRIDHLINEAAASGRPDLHLLLCGQPEAETAGLKILGEQKLPRRCTWLTLPVKEMPKAYAAADWFVLPSLSEGLGAVLIEAAAAGLGVYAHRMPPAQFILGEDYPGLIDMAKPGELADWLRGKDHRFRPQMIEQTSLEVKSRFSGSELASELVGFLVPHSPEYFKS